MATQQRKLTDNKDRWGIIMMVIPSTSGDQQTLCMPVQKLLAFMVSINPKKVREELRERIRLYQDACVNAMIYPSEYLSDRNNPGMLLLGYIKTLNAR